MDAYTQEIYERIAGDIEDLKSGISYRKGQIDACKRAMSDHESKIKQYEAQILVYEKMLRAVEENV